MFSKIRIKNFKSIEDLLVDFSYAEGKAPNNYKDSNIISFLEPNSKADNRVVSVMNMYGANASGKSNIIEVLSHITNIIRNGLKPDNNISDDYDGQKMWVAFRMKNLLPNDISKFWPSFLMLSAGYGVTGIGDYALNKDLQKKFYLAFDFDASEIPLYGEFWEFIKNTLNYIHFPLPGIEISNNGISFLLFAY